MNRRVFSLVVMHLVVLFAVSSGYSSSHEPFYRDKVVRLIVGFAAGGGFDTNARILSRHMGKHIPGEPSVIVENMTGAGSLIAANYIYKAGKPDGLTIGTFAGGLIMSQLFEKPGIEFDARKFFYLGVPLKSPSVCALTKASGVTSIDKWFASKIPIKVGGLSPGNTTDDVPKILKATTGLPVQVVSGYKGTSAIRLAAESGEVAGGCWDWVGVQAGWHKRLETGEVVVVLQITPTPLQDLPNVPLAINFARGDNARKLIQVGIHEQEQLLRLYVLAPGTPKERAEILRKAFQETMKDPAFVSDMQKAKLPVDALPGSEVERIVQDFFQLDRSFVAELKEVLR